MVRERARASARDAIEIEAEVIERIKSPALMCELTFVVDHSLPSEREFAKPVSKDECETAGTGGLYHAATASDLGAVRGSSTHICDIAGEGGKSTAQRERSSSITPSNEAVAGE